MDSNFKPFQVFSPRWPRQDADDMVDLLDPLLKMAPAEASVSFANPSGVPDPYRPGYLERVNPTFTPRLGEPAQCVDTVLEKATDRLAPSRGILLGLQHPSCLFNASLDGNTRRAVDFHAGATVDEAALNTLVRAAVALNTPKARSRRANSA